MDRRGRGAPRIDGGSGHRPDDPGHPATLWPPESLLSRADDVPTLVMLAHPRCPCMIASLDELERLLTSAAVAPRVYIVITLPVGAPAGFEQGEALDRARGLPGAVVVLDRDASETSRFGVRTSGHVLAYDRHGGLIFAGGVTPWRGHRGDSAGRRALVALLNDGAGDEVAPVYGCPLEDS